MGIFSGISQILYSLTNLLGTPMRSLRGVTTRMRTFRSTNPLSQGTRSLRFMAFRLMSPFKSLRNSTRVLRLPPGISGNKYVAGLRESLADLGLGGRGKGERKRKRRRGGAEVAAYTQVHFVGGSSQTRTILHLGASIGSSRSEVTLQRGGHRPVTLRLNEMDTQQHAGTILLTYLSGEARLEVDGEPVSETAQVRAGSRLWVDEQEYAVEVYGFGQLPAVTPLEAAWATNIGPVRKDNEDAIGIYQHAKASLFVLADGVGGGEAGEAISEYAVQYMLAAFHENVRFNFHWSEIFRRAMTRINAEVRAYSTESMFTAGSTLTAIVMQGWEAQIAHVGDSRLYLWRSGRIQRLTSDHIEETLPSQASNGDGAGEDETPKVRNVLAKAIGKADEIEPDLMRLRLLPGDKFLLCSDGISDQFKDSELGDMLAVEPLPLLPGKLIEAANERYNTDNASAVVIATLAEEVEAGRAPRSQDRVYIGYDSSWLLRLKRQREIHTRYPLAPRLRRWVVVSIVILGLAIIGFLLVDGARVAPPEREEPLVAATPTLGGAVDSADSGTGGNG